MDATFIQNIKQGMEYERDRKTPPDGFPPLPAIPGGRYTDPEFLALEQKYLWKKSWLYACHIDQLPEPGSFMLWEKTGSPILIIRDQAGQVGAFYNTCRHRGGPIVKTANGTLAERVTCGYHGWTYNLQGELVALRDKRDFPDFDMSCYALVRVHCDRIGNWIFINEDPDAEPLHKHFQPITEQLTQFQPDNIRHIHSATYDVACNIKVMMDAFLEVYHLASIHKDTVDRFLDHRGTTINLWPKGHSLMTTPNRREDWIDPGTVGMQEIPTVTEIPARNNISYNFYPNLVSPMASTGMPFLTFWPTGPATMQIDCHWFAPTTDDPAQHDLWQTRIANFERILYEDTQFAPQIQGSVESDGFKGINLCYQERRIYHWHEELDRRIGPDKIPTHLQVQPTLAPYVEQP
ncbi:MAG: aromatic ring-hydroxylating oxygenase subunit alpha [Gammaproteobacteria bacterium]